MSNIGTIIEYEDILLGKRKNFSASCMGKAIKEKDALMVIQYSFEKLLRWPPDVIVTYLNPDIVKMLHLQRPIAKVNFPAELDPERDLFYLAQAVYPQQIRFSKQKTVLHIYQRVLQRLQPKYPKNFFTGPGGVTNACICLQYAINQKLSVHTVRDLYKKFSNATWAINFLRENRLYVPFYQNYEYPIDMLHEALAETDKDELSYHLYRFQTDYSAAKRRFEG